jgi:serine kinase of HPr protein (carbohydrate metabolism regulator)
MPEHEKSFLLHATCVALDGVGVLLGGPSGSGKSDLALRLIDGGAILVSDDQVALSVREGRLSASPPATIAGMIEAREIGLMRLPFCADVPVALYVELVPEAEVLERLPEEETISFLDIPLRKLTLHAFHASTAAKIRAVLRFPMASL